MSLLRKVRSVGWHADRVFTDQCAVLDDALGQATVLRRIDRVQPAAANGQGAASGDKGCIVRVGVDTACQSADNRHAGGGKLTRDLFAHVAPIRGRSACADDPDGIGS